MNLFILSIIAGIMIGIGGLVNLSIGGVAGAIVFSVGLLTIIYFFQLIIYHYTAVCVNSYFI